MRPDRDDLPILSPHTITQLWIFSKYIVKWQMVTKCHHPPRLWRVIAIRPYQNDPQTFSPHSITPPWIFSKTFANWPTVKNRHHSSRMWRVVAIRPDWTIRLHFHHNTAKNIFSHTRTDWQMSRNDTTMTIHPHVPNWHIGRSSHDPSRIDTSLATRYGSGVLGSPHFEANRLVFHLGMPKRRTKT